MYQNYFFLKLRSALRIFGITKIIGKFIARKDYEMLFENALVSHIHSDDIIYDIGANRGFYTKIFLEKAPMGKVFAFEPVPFCNAIISKLNNDHLVVYPIALGSKKGVFPMSIGSDDLNATSSVKKIKEANDIMVNVETLDDIVAENNFIPNVLKIDVEGFELDILNGMASTIRREQVSVIAIEVHFKLLENNGFKNGPKEIVNILKQNNFKVDWVDPSHIVATRGRS